MKKIISIMLAVLLLASLGTAALADESYEIKQMGLTLHDVDTLLDAEGIVMPYPYGQISENPDVYYMPVLYFAMDRAVYDEINSKENPTQEEIDSLYDAQGIVGAVLVSDGTLDEMTALFDVDDPTELGAEEFGSADGYTFYYVSGADEAYLSSIGEKFAEDYANTEIVLKEMLQNADLCAPVEPGADQIGKAVSFESVDTEGNAVTSEELFSGNKVTMINYWGTWCHNCVDEMEELAKINTRLQEKGCGVIGILQDGDIPEKLELAKEIMAEKGTNYTNVIFSDDMEFLADISSFPTTFFVDSNGVVLCTPIAGAAVEEYENVVDQLLAGEEISRVTTPEAGANNTDAYRVIVVDVNGDPIEGVMVQFCDDSSCNMGKTDADGVASFALPEGTVYTVHILKAPEGYEKVNDEFRTLDVYSDVVIALGAAA